MSRCAARNELAEVALGAAPSEALSLHLSECRACAAELERQRALARRMEVAVNALARSQVPSRLFESITARARSTQRSQPWSGAWRGAALGAALAASAIGLIFALRAPQSPVKPDAASALAAWRSPTGALLEPRGSVLASPLYDVWFRVEPRLSRS
jgi:anti-sigma factor RsiW